MRLLLLLLFCFCFSCIENEDNAGLVTHNGVIITPNKRLSTEKLKEWLYKDLMKDSIPGISLERSLLELLENKIGEEVIIAVLDRPVDIYHKNLKGIIWKNSKEISNGIDDDGNGYIDDIHGWNFLGNRNGEVSDVQLYGCVRVINKYKSLFDGIASEDVKPIDLSNYNMYIRAKKEYEEELKLAKEDLEYAQMIKSILVSTKKTMSRYFSNENYTLKDLDSLKEVYPTDSLLQKHIIKRYNFIKYGFTDAYISNYEWEAISRFEKCLNFNFNERTIQGDDPYDIKDQNYGNSQVDVFIDKFTHGTRVAGAFLFNKPDSDLITKSPIKIMPIVISAYGSNHSKDIALGIRYAVDNGAKIINMSFTIQYDTELWVQNAIKYAEKNNVIIVKGAGNSNTNLDSNIVYDFPDDRNMKGDEFVNNFIKVGSSTYHINNNLKSNFSSYGKENVDLFAPGDSIYTTIPNNKFQFERGTSMSTMVVSNVAALIYSNYPSLTASEVKQILMDSSVKYDILVDVPTKENPDQQLPFSELSKSGGIVNAYNAMLMAEAYVKNKK